MNKLLGVLVFFICSFAYSGISQQRSPTETFQQIIGSIYKENPHMWLREHPLNKKVPIKEIDYSLAPQVQSYDELIRMFYLIRDTRFLYQKNMPDFARRISWLYPDDGCFARAAMSGIKLRSEHYIRPAKIFVFGDLILQTPYSAAGAVYWWYHVASIVNYMGTLYVLDPALKDDGPMPVQDWYNRLGAESDLSGVVCNEYTYDALDYCFQATLKSDEHASQDQINYLKKEWDRINILGYDAQLILGDSPPW